MGIDDLSFVVSRVIISIALTILAVKPVNIYRHVICTIYQIRIVECTSIQVMSWIMGLYN